MPGTEFVTRARPAWVIFETHFSRDTQLTIDWFAARMVESVERISDGSVLTVAPFSVTSKKTHNQNVVSHFQTIFLERRTVGTWKGKYCLLFLRFEASKLLKCSTNTFKLNQIVDGVTRHCSVCSPPLIARIDRIVVELANYSHYYYYFDMRCVCLDYVIGFIFNRQSTKLIIYNISSTIEMISGVWIPQNLFCNFVSMPRTCNLWTERYLYLFQLIKEKLSTCDVWTYACSGIAAHKICVWAWDQWNALSSTSVQTKSGRRRG